MSAAAPPPSANLAFPTRYRLGWGRRAELPDEAARAGIRRALVVTDPGVAAQPWAEPLLDALRAAGGEVFAAISSNPTEEEVLAGVARYVAAGCDGVVAVGGGSPMDAGKLIGLLAGHRDAWAPRPGLAAELAVGGARSRAIDGARVPPLVALPTTAGTGAELSTGAVLTDPAARAKRTFLHPALMPAAVVADPEVTVGLPPALTAATGFDALTHAVEAVCAPGYHPMCDAIGLDAIARIVRWLPVAVAAPADARARTELLMASGMAAVAFQKGLGLAHAMAHPLGAATGVHHGLANAVLLAPVLATNRDALAEPAARIAAACGLPAGGDPVDAVLALVERLRESTGLPARVAPPAGDRAAAIAALVDGALRERVYLATNPRPVTADDVAAAYDRALA